MNMSSNTFTNRLAREKSPYLLQHAHNPVDWFPWGEEAFQKSRQENRPIFLSIGYATCHWCHVMAHESFEDREAANILNQDFVAIKVDREERPDIDHIYMSVCQALTGQGGWPLSIFMTPEGKPFYAGTYFPKRTHMGRPGFIELLQHISRLWKSDQAKVLKAGEEITTAIRGGLESKGEIRELSQGTLKKAYTQLARSFDPHWGGFSQAPKFPTPHNLTFLLRWFARKNDKPILDMVDKTLMSMRHGGLFDQVGYGFHRYSVDEKWLVPHFEKMLYDQALLAMAFIEAGLVTGHEKYAHVVREIFTYVLRDMTSPQGGFYSAEDADSEGREGLFYVWRPEEIREVLGKETAELICRFWDISARGNFEEGASIPHTPVSDETFARHQGLDLESFQALLISAREKLFLKRKERVHPLKDDKILTSWNGLMIAALAKGYRALGDKAYLEAGQKAVKFIFEHLVDDQGRLLRRYRDGEALHPAYLDDYAFLVWGLIELYEADFQPGYLQKALSLTNDMIHLFWDDKDNGFFYTAPDHESLIVRTKEVYDGALPSGNSVAALNLLRLGRMTGDVELERKTGLLLSAFSDQIENHPVAYTQLLQAVDFMIGPSREIVISGSVEQEETRAMIRAIHNTFLPRSIFLLRPESDDTDVLFALSPFLKNMVPMNNQTTAYVCEQYACQEPLTDLNKLERALK